MKLITHNMLTSRCIAGVKEGYPLRIEATQTKRVEIVHNSDFVKRMLPKISWNVLKFEAANFGIELPEDNPWNPSTGVENQGELPVDLSERIHEALLGIEIIEGALVCPETNHKFSIRNGVPNMLINEDQV